MSRFRKLSQTIWHCQYHKVWTPKYRYRILKGEIAEEVEECIQTFTAQQKCEIVEYNVQIDHVHLVVFIPPKISVSNFMGLVKGRTAIRALSKFRKLRQQPYWSNKFWAGGYCVDTVGLDAEMIRKYVKYQEDQEKKAEKKRH